MKKILLAFFIFFVLNTLYAHAPSDVKIDYDMSAGVVKVIVIHDLKTSPVQDPKKHYIKTITIKINGKNVKTNTFKMQESINSQTTIFDKISVVKGNKITVEAECSLLGTKSSTIVVK
jgi:hypothetical protein